MSDNPHACRLYLVVPADSDPDLVATFEKAVGTGYVDAAVLRCRSDGTVDRERADALIQAAARHDVAFLVENDVVAAGSLGADGAQRRVHIDLQPADVAGRAMLLVDDILDHGFTLAALRDRMARWGVRSVQVCVLLDKQLSDPPPHTLAQRAKAAPDLVGFEIPDVWVAGYGLDAAGALRHLPCIVAVDGSD